MVVETTAKTTIKCTQRPHTTAHVEEDDGGGGVLRKATNDLGSNPTRFRKHNFQSCAFRSQRTGHTNSG